MTEPYLSTRDKSIYRDRSLKGWATRRLAVDWTAAQRDQYRIFMHATMRAKVVLRGGCRSCCRPREASRRHFTECVACAKISAIRSARHPHRYTPQTQVRSAA